MGEEKLDATAASSVAEYDVHLTWDAPRKAWIASCNELGFVLTRSSLEDLMSIIKVASVEMAELNKIPSEEFALRYKGLSIEQVYALGDFTITTSSRQFIKTLSGKVEYPKHSRDPSYFIIVNKSGRTHKHIAINSDVSSPIVKRLATIPFGVPSDLVDRAAEALFSLE